MARPDNAPYMVSARLVTLRGGRQVVITYIRRVEPSDNPLLIATGIRAIRAMLAEGKLKGRSHSQIQASLAKLDAGGYPGFEPGLGK